MPRPAATARARTSLEPDCLAAALEIEAQRQRHDRSRLDMMRAYITTEGCRRQFLLQYFGDFAVAGGLPAV
ncbi:MAG: RecQ family zinc-binding domain-containing protein [Dehalococcoidia bacterium]